MKDRNHVIYTVTLIVVVIAYLLIYLFGITVKHSIYLENSMYVNNIPKQPINSIFSLVKEKEDDTNKSSGKDKDKDKTNGILFKYEETSNAIDLVNQFPTADEVGRNFSGNKYVQDFRLKLNVHATNVQYIITLTKDKGSNLEDELTKIYLESDGEPITNIFRSNGRIKTYNEYQKYLNKNDERILYEGTITSQEAMRGHKDFTLKMWISEDLKVFNEDYLARVFKARIKVYAVKF